MNTKEYKEYRKLCEEMLKNNPESVITALENAKMMGFEQLSIDLKQEKNVLEHHKNREAALSKQGFEFGKLKQMRLLKMRLGLLPRMLKGLKTQFNELSQNDSIDYTSGEADSIWDELNDYARDKWDIQSIGFTEVPRELVFKDHYILYKYAIVIIEEMKKEKIDTAPSVPATTEVMRVYAHLGEAANDIAQWLRKWGLKAQPIHPLGGLLNTVPLAGKAGLGWQGRHGMLITPEFGPRHRVTPILIEKPFFKFTDSRKHEWVEDFCKSCGKCSSNCPTGAIFNEKIPYGEIIEGIGKLKTCIDYKKCYAYFEPSGGCSVCIKVCPFSQGMEVYEKLRKSS